MPVVRVLVDERVGARVWVKRVGTDEVRACEVVPEMAVDRVDEKELPVLVPIVAPRIGGAGAEGLDNFSPRVITPNRAAQRDAFLRRRAWHAHLARARRPTAAIEPAVRAESQAIGEGMVHIRRTREAVEQNFWRAIRHIVAIAVGNKTQLRRTHRPHAPVPDFDAGEHLQFVGEYFSRVEPAVTVLVFEDEDAIAQIEIELPAALRVSIVL